MTRPLHFRNVATIDLGFFTMQFLKSVLAAAVFALPALSTPTFAADALGSYGGVGPCADARVFKTIGNRFDYQVRHVPHLPQVAIMSFQDVREREYQPATEDHPIARRYCGASVALSNGDHRQIWYLIEEGMSFATLIDGLGMADDVRGSNVEFCVSGFDRWMVYNGWCRVLR